MKLFYKILIIIGCVLVGVLLYSISTHPLYRTIPGLGSQLMDVLILVSILWILVLRYRNFLFTPEKFYYSYHVTHKQCYSNQMHKLVHPNFYCRFHTVPELVVTLIWLIDFLNITTSMIESMETSAAVRNISSLLHMYEIHFVQGLVQFHILFH